MTLTLMFRTYCSLCHHMQAALNLLQEELDFQLEIVEIDDFPELEQKYNELVPVLLHEENQLCHWHLDEAALRAYLAKVR